MRRKCTFGIVLCTMVLLTLDCCGQGENNNWHFGSTSITFNGGGPVALSTPSLFRADEGCASVSDPAGQLLYYTNGVDVYNRAHQRMPAFTGVPFYSLGGGASSTHAAVAVPKPGSDRFHYIFSVAECGFGYGPARYAVIDMQLDGGFGDVVPCTRENLWVPGNLLQIGDTTFHEKLASVRHANGRDVWVIAHRWESNEFWAVKVTPCGVDTANVVVSAVGTYIGGFQGYPTNNDRGMLMVNEQGTKLVMCNEGPAGPAGFDLLDFDNATGVVSNPMSFPSPFAPYNGSTYCYGGVFSPSGDRLYISSWYHNAILQFDLSLGSQAAIQASMQTIGSTALQTAPDRGFSHMRLGPDGKIYCAIWNTSYLGVVNAPDALGAACNYTDGAVTCLPSGVLVVPGVQDPVQRGLPAPVRPSVPVLPDTLVTCVGQPLAFTLPADLDAQCLGFVSWVFGDPSSGALNTSTDVSAQHTYLSPGAYVAGIAVDQGCLQDTLLFSVLVVDSASAIPTVADTSLCPGATVDLIVAPVAPGTSILWSTGVQDDTLSVSQPGTYIYQLVSGCTSLVDSVLVSPSETVPPFQVPDTAFCAGFSVQLTVPPQVAANAFVWSTGSTQPAVVFSAPGVGFLDVFGACGAVRDSFLVSPLPVPLIELLDSLVLCRGAAALLVPDSLSGMPLWSTGSTEANLLVTDGGLYVLTTTTPCGAAMDSVRVVSVICDSALVCSTIYMPNAFTPNGDGINDVVRPQYDPSCGLAVELLLFDRWGELILTWYDGDAPWDGRYNGSECQLGVYAYKLSYRTANNMRRVVHGHVSLIR